MEDGKVDHLTRSISSGRVNEHCEPRLDEYNSGTGCPFRGGCLQGWHPQKPCHEVSPIVPIHLFFSISFDLFCDLSSSFIFGCNVCLSLFLPSFLANDVTPPSAAAHDREWAAASVEHRGYFVTNIIPSLNLPYSAGSSVSLALGMRL